MPSTAGAPVAPPDSTKDDLVIPMPRPAHCLSMRLFVLVTASALVSFVACGSHVGGVVAGLPDGAAAESSVPIDAGRDTLDDPIAEQDTEAEARVMVQACDLAPVGAWQAITPPQVSLPGPSGSTFGTNAFVLDPSQPGVVYLGTSSQGIYKTTDCGSTWVHIDTGNNGAKLDTGRNWTMVIDPIHPDTLYTNSGYGGLTGGLVKSTNGGVDWDIVWPPANDPTWANVVGDGSFLGMVSMDPGDPTHLLLLFHADCAAPHQPVCLGESTDAGQSWRIVEGDPKMAGAHGGSLFFLGNAKTWLYRETGGLWRTADGGSSWTQVSTVGNDGAGSQIYRSATGAFYIGLQSGLARSTDGISWSIMPGTGQFTGGIAGDGTTIYASDYTVCFDWNSPITPYFTSPEADGMTWTAMPTSPPVQQGGTLAYDASHHILYSSNCQDGFWRVRTQ
jgi:hypothetical protein